MKERPILFSGPMVRAILEGRKTQTRRVIKQPLEIGEDAHGKPWPFYPAYVNNGDNEGELASSPYGVPGDRLWVRETHAIMSVDTATVSVARRERMPPGKTLAQTDGGIDLIYVDRGTRDWAEAHIDTERWRPAIFMPRWASRITLEVDQVRVERLQEISDVDAFAEGVQTVVNDGQIDDGTARGAYRTLWDSINLKRGFGWDSNPWVWAITFNRLR